MRIGFTGTRDGMTKIQADVVAACVRELRPSELHHGSTCKSNQVVKSNHPLRRAARNCRAQTPNAHAAPSL